MDNGSRASHARLHNYEAYCLFASHFIFQWNSKFYEYAVVGFYPFRILLIA